MRIAPLPAFLFIALVAASPPGAAANVIIYRCTDAFGALTIQNAVPCAKGSRQQKQVIEPPPPMPAYKPAAAPAPPAPMTIAPVTIAPALPSMPGEVELPAIADTDRLPPPALYQCNTYDNDSYLSEDATPAPRCVRLETTNLAGAADNSAGVACQMVTDQCQRIADAAACGAWTKRLRETQAQWKFSPAVDVDANLVDYQRVQKILHDSTCGR